MCVPHDMVKLCFILLVSCCIAHAGEESGRDIFAKRGESRGTRGRMAMAEGIHCRPYFSWLAL